MEKLDYPSINNGRPAEQNIMAIKSYLCNMVDQLNYMIGMLDSRISEIEKGTEEE